MGKVLSVDDISGCTPTQHYLRGEASIEPERIIIDRCFNAQSSNLNRILRNSLDLSEIEKIKTLDRIPSELQEKMFDGVAQLELQKQIANMRGDKFSLDMDQVPQDEPSFK